MPCQRCMEERARLKAIAAKKAAAVAQMMTRRRAVMKERLRGRSK